jgi:hypothetical protein
MLEVFSSTFDKLYETNFQRAKYENEENYKLGTAKEKDYI